MDEIGRMERRADGYSAHPDASGRLRAHPRRGPEKGRHPLAAAIRSHPNVRLIEVSEENRDVLLPEILSALRS